eukprot:6191698-Pleurochrysis_carterae.AAC.5
MSLCRSLSKHGQRGMWGRKAGVKGRKCEDKEWKLKIRTSSYDLKTRLSIKHRSTLNSSGQIKASGQVSLSCRRCASHLVVECEPGRIGRTEAKETVDRGEGERRGAAQRARPRQKRVAIGVGARRVPERGDGGGEGG